MTDADPKLTLAEIARRVDQLVAVIERLSDENRSLRQAQDQLVAERANLLAKNEQARSRVEAMIARLRALETSG
jgi:cell division protein ZapB